MVAVRIWASQVLRRCTPLPAHPSTPRVRNTGVFRVYRSELHPRRAESLWEQQLQMRVSPDSASLLHPISPRPATWPQCPLGEQRRSREEGGGRVREGTHIGYWRRKGTLFVLSAGWACTQLASSDPRGHAKSGA